MEQNFYENFFAGTGWYAIVTVVVVSAQIFLFKRMEESRINL